MNRPIKLFAPHAYVLIRKTQVCRHCGTQTQSSELYTKHYLMGQDGTDALPCHALQYNLPIEREFKTIRTPICHECMDGGYTALQSLPPPPFTETKPTPVKPVRPQILVAKRPLAEALAAHRTKKQPKTLDDVFNL